MAQPLSHHMTLRVVTIAALLLFAAASDALAQAGRPRTVVALYWGAAESPANTTMMNALHEMLLSRGDLTINLFSEYLESDRLPLENTSEALRDLIARKYRQHPIDVVVAVSDTALQFALRYRDTLFPNVPIVFAALAAPSPVVRNAGAGMTGVVGGVALRETLQLALHLHPKTQRVFVLEAGSSTASVRSQLAALADRVDVSYVNDPDLPRLLTTVRSMPPRSVALLVLLNQPGGATPPAQVARRVAETAQVPVYAISDSFIGSGIVGTAGISVQDMGTRVGRLVLDILDGRRAQDLPLVDRPRRPVIDWRQVERWHINASLLPMGADIRFRQAGVWELYWPYIAGAISLCALEGALIAALMFQRARRRETEAHNAAILRAAPDLMFLLSWDGVYLSYHAPDETQLQLPPERFLGRHMRDVLPPELADAFLERFTHLAPGQAAEIIECAWPTPDGERKYEARLVAIGAHQVLAVVRDITERHHAELALNEAQAELRRTSRLGALGQFAASIAHELRQPLTAIAINARSCVRMIGNSPPDLEELKAALIDVVDASHRAEEVIRRNRRLFRDHTLEVEPLDINGVIIEAIALATPRIELQRVTVLSSLASQLPGVGGDRIELQQVLVNLIVNAVEAMDAADARPRRVHITSSLEEGHVKVSVADTGIGLRGVNARQIFVLSYTTKATGTGVGLALSRSIIEAHGGRIWGVQNADRGATFSFTIPALVASAVDTVDAVSAR
jgi:signal transduction histidine kinase/ABC-type uncharacterized transport system substrate-binding protein